MLTLALASMLPFAQCAPNVAPETMSAIVRVESSNNPYAIGVVDGALRRQPTSLDEAKAAVAELERQGKNYSMGLAQINKHNLPKYGITAEQAFDPCTSLRVGGLILADCYERALPRQQSEQQALHAALSCYYSGNFTRGFRPDVAGGTSYVQRVVAASSTPVQRTRTVPALEGASPLPVALQAAAADTAVAQLQPQHSNSVLADDASQPDPPATPAATPKASKAVADASSASEPVRLSLVSEQPQVAASRDDSTVVF